MVNTNRSTIGMLAALSVLLIVFAAVTKAVLDWNYPQERGIKSTITVSGLEAVPAGEAGGE